MVKTTLARPSGHLAWRRRFGASLLPFPPLLMDPLTLAIIFAVIAIIAAFFGFRGAAGMAATVAKIAFFIFLVLAVLALIF